VLVLLRPPAIVAFSPLLVFELPPPRSPKVAAGVVHAATYGAELIEYFVRIGIAKVIDRPAAGDGSADRTRGNKIPGRTSHDIHNVRMVGIIQCRFQPQGAGAVDFDFQRLIVGGPKERAVRRVRPALPAVFQKLELLNPPSVAAFTSVRPEPLPVKLLAALLNVIALE